MRALQHCDFCDSEAAGTFEVLPPELEPTDTEQRRVVLCPACKEQLGTLLEPLLARLRGEPAVEVDGAANRSGTHADERSEEGSEDGDESETESEDQSDAPSTARGNEITFGDAEAVETAATSGIETGETAGSESAATLEADRDPESKSKSGSGSEPATSTDTEPAGELEPVPETQPATNADADATSDTSATTGETRTDSVSTARKTDEPSKPSVPQAYPKVIRLLRNRELPMDRTAVESLAAGAYDLEAEQAEAIVDHALEKEEFTERSGKLHRA
ncbi:hypothetical protein [Natrialba sp. SSL1]|uniref:hypothetical protein n=1 Tax=Natrialba sp. SSL1 TaxID=1869245 RepID=UPI0008F845E1|nr:hypothetical protein [Natrialba sp. SSL1]OIB55340.1 hypothetical protein BBD46_03275 [Natrialba sp. SSL1]